MREIVCPFGETEMSANGAGEMNAARSRGEVRVRKGNMRELPTIIAVRHTAYHGVRA